MKINKMILISLATLLLFSGCSKQDEVEDFWSATYHALADRLENNGYYEDNWQIGVEDPSQIKEEGHPNMTIRQYDATNDVAYERIMYAFQHDDQEKTVSYIYELSEGTIEDQIIHNVTLKSVDELYEHYKITYTKQLFHNGNFVEQQEAEGTMTIHNGRIQSYDNVPYLKETMEKLQKLINDVQDEFDLDYDSYSFVNVPALAQGLEIPELREISEDSSLTDNYYGEAQINAKGYSLIPFLYLDKNFSSVRFGQYVIEQKAYASDIEAELEARDLPSCYNIIQKNDPDIQYALYVQGDICYLYEQSMSDQEILLDVQNHGTQALYIMDKNHLGF